MYLKKFRILQIVFLSLIGCLPTVSFAGGEDGIETISTATFTKTVSTGTTTALVNTSSVQLQYTAGTEISKKINNIISLNVIEETPKYIASDFTATVEVSIDYGASSSSYHTLQHIFTVEYKKADGVKYNAKNYLKFENAQYVKVTIVQVNAPLVNGLQTEDILELTSEMRVRRIFQLANNVQPVSLAVSSSTSDAFTISWSWPTTSGANYTQLEWVWVEDESIQTYHKNGNLDYGLLFKNNGTRVDLPISKSVYSIPLFYDGDGKVYYRIRAVNLRSSGNRSDGPWSSVNTFTHLGHDDNLNWQATSSYAEEGNRKTVMQYFDGSLRGRQTVTKDNLTNETIVAETFYDAQGRPAVQILPVPGVSNVIGYTKNLNLFASNSSLNLPSNQAVNTDPAKYFDLQPLSTTTSLTPLLINTTGTSKYYSANNPDASTGPDKFLPNAEGYPYSVTRYTQDGTGRVMSQSGVGASLKMSTGRETKYYYGGAAQEELDALFGTEAGNYTHYFKNMVKDANNQMSVSYVDMHGRTIATALAGAAPVNLTSLDLNLYPNQSGNTLTRNLLDNGTNLVKGNRIESVNTILVPATTNYSFRYELNPASLQLDACEAATYWCYDCLYNLEITITDESGETATITKKFNNVTVSPDYNCATAVPGFKDEATSAVSNIITFNQTLPPGSYAVRKTLTISEKSLETYKAQYLASKAECFDESVIIDSVRNALLSSSGCGTAVPLDCTSCLTALGDSTTFKTNYLASAPNATPAEMTAAYAAAKLDCDRLCDNVSQTLSSIRQMMLADMMPDSGQYARSTPPGTGATMFVKYNIFDSVNTSHPFYKKPLNSVKAPAYYYNELGSIDPTIHQGLPGTLLKWKLDTITRQPYVELFNTSWAEALLPYHPEYDKLVYAEQNLAASYQWINNFLQVDTYSDAVTANYIMTSSPTLIDPFYVTASGLKPTMVGYLTGNYMQGLSLWQLAYGSVKCSNITDPASRNACFGSALDPTDPAFHSTLTTTEKDKVWKIFSHMYAMERNKQVNAFINTSVSLPDTSTLVSEGYTLHFPNSNAQLATQYGWNWYPPVTGGAPVIPTTGSGSVSGTYTSRCNSYISRWEQALLKCEQLATHGDQQEIITSIINRMLMVCERSTNAANPYGASNVADDFPDDGMPRSFEEVINYVLFDSLGFSKDEFCNPFTIESPKPYSKGPSYIREMISGVDSCACDQFTKLINAASEKGYEKGHEGVNLYLSEIYNDSISVDLYNAMEEYCGQIGNVYCEGEVCDTVRYVPLETPQYLPAALKCGYQTSPRCLDCDTYTGYVNRFREDFPGPYNQAPFFEGEDLEEEQMNHNALFARYLNYHTGFNYTWMDYAKAYYANCSQLLLLKGEEQISAIMICDSTKALNDTTGVFIPEDPCTRVENMAIFIGAEIYKTRKQQMAADFKAAYRAKCMAAKDVEQFTVTYSVSEYHYTLYYYDQAGNLVKTVPPKGVYPGFRKTFSDSVIAARAAGTQLVPPHDLVTQYRYNSLNQVVAQKTPDAGKSEFWYDRLGRLVVSRNAKQAAEGKYSYTLYDPMGRITEVGQKPQDTLMTDALSRDTTLLKDWIVTNGGVREQITYTVYDHPYLVSLAPLITQQNLRNRVSYSATKDLFTNSFHAAASFYTYDIHGNVDTLLQDYKGIYEVSGNNNRFKRITYDYDLISGKVKGVNYQPGDVDAFYHKYEYDLENRLINVRTSRDKIVWERDGDYSYYKHGPLSRVELGQLRVQGLDYAYTLQGWLKGVNSTSIDPQWDMGEDGKIGSGSSELVSRDVVGFSLDYYGTTNDYKTINTAYKPFATASAAGFGFKGLYNGNIAGMSVNIGKLNSPLLYTYNYDQLNRLTKMFTYTGLSNVTNSWDVAATDQYREQVSYDPNGNILTYSRNGSTAGGAPLAMDNLTYQYPKDQTSGRAINNRLRYVHDQVSATNYTVDIDNQTSLTLTQVKAEKLPEQSGDNYTYDAIGNLVKDTKENISNIEWTVYGKIKEIQRTGGGRITYQYDASGNRISKTVYGIASHDIKTTIYVRDAQGNVMSIYQVDGGTSSSTVYQKEVHIYGSSRIGLENSTVNVSDIELTWPLMQEGYGIGTVHTFERGVRAYEISNHLGNVLTTITDKKQQHTTDNINVDYYLADVMSASDYYPFGMLMPGRTFSAGGYRYGFNGKESDNEVAGEGNSYDYGFRIYNSRIGKFLSVDPLFKGYPWYTPYQFAGNKPIWATDLDGLEENTTSTYVKKPIELKPIVAKPTFNGAITITDATTEKVHKVFDGTYAKLRESDRSGVSRAIVNGLVGADVGTSSSSLSITMTGTRTQFVKTWKGADYKYFTQYSFSFTDNNVTRAGTFEVDNATIQASARIWDPLLFVVLNKVVSSIFGSTITTPWGKAVQSTTDEALEASKKVYNGTTLYRLGTNGKSATGEQAQFWSLENPLVLGAEEYAKKYGVPLKNVKNANFVETATLKQGAKYITREAPIAPGAPPGAGGGIEAVVQQGGTSGNLIKPIKF